MGSLMELGGQYLHLFELIESGEGSKEAVENAIDQLSEELLSKGEAYVAVANRLDMEYKWAAEREKKYKAMKKARETAKDRLMEKAKEFMLTTGIKEIPAGDFKIVLKGNGGVQALEIPDESLIPEEYLKTVPDNDKIRAYLSELPEDIVCPWAHLKERGVHAEVKEGKA